MAGLGARLAALLLHARRVHLDQVQLPGVPLERHPKFGEVAPYAQGEIRVYRGIVNKWLLVVYAILAVWGVYYLFKYWGGLGPGLAVGQ